MKVRTIPLVTLMFFIAGCDQLSSPRDYDDCILKSMEGVKSDMAARAIILSCREKFPKEVPESEDLPIDAISKLTGRASMGSFGNFSGNIYNGNEDWTVTQITVRLTPKGEEKSAEAFLDSKDYNEDVTVKPFTSVSFSFEVGSQRLEYSWQIVRAKGYR